jgi:hypothetical protein
MWGFVSCKESLACRIHLYLLKWWRASVNMSSADRMVGEWSAPALVGQLVGWLMVNQLLWLVGRRPQTNRLTKPFGWLVRLVAQLVGRLVVSQPIRSVGNPKPTG